MTEVVRFARQHGLWLIEDAAQAIGVCYQGKHAGTFGDVGCFSFYADKTLTTGEGGYVICRDADIFERLQLFRNQGRIAKGTFIHPSFGFNFHYTDLQAAIGLAQITKLGEIIARKQRILSWYHHGLDEVEQVQFIQPEPYSEYVPFRVVLFCQEAHCLMAFLEQHGIQTRASFYPLHKQPCFNNSSNSRYHAIFRADNDYPNANRSYEQGVLLPVYPTLTEEQVQYICETIKKFYHS